LCGHAVQEATGESETAARPGASELNPPLTACSTSEAKLGKISAPPSVC
jgi:hypothetical protein